METTLRKPTMFWLKTDLIDRLKIAAQRENRDLNNYVESVLMDVVYHEEALFLPSVKKRF